MIQLFAFILGTNGPFLALLCLVAWTQDAQNLTAPEISGKQPTHHKILLPKENQSIHIIV